MNHSVLKTMAIGNGHSFNQRYIELGQSDKCVPPPKFQTLP